MTANYHERNHWTGTAAEMALCAPVNPGAVWFQTDTLDSYWWDGAAWQIVGSGVGLPDHDHSGDPGDGGQFDADHLLSSGANDGDVLTADGAGNSAWEPPAAGMALQISLFNGGEWVANYGTDILALQAAAAAAVDGDVIFCPNIDVTGDVTIAPGVGISGLSIRKTIIRGMITFEPGCLLENLSVINQLDEPFDAIGVTAQATAPDGRDHRIRLCEIAGYNCGHGDGIGILIDSADVILVVDTSVIMGDAASHAGYAFANDGGDVTVHHSEYYGKTEVFHDI